MLQLEEMKRQTGSLSSITRAQSLEKRGWRADKWSGEITDWGKPDFIWPPLIHHTSLSRSIFYTPVDLYGREVEQDHYKLSAVSWE